MNQRLQKALEAQRVGAAVPDRVIDDDILAANTDDGLRLTAAQRADAERALATGAQCETKEAARARAVSIRLHFRAAGIFA